MENLTHLTAQNLRAMGGGGGGVHTGEARLSQRSKDVDLTWTSSDRPKQATREEGKEGLSFL